MATKTRFYNIHKSLGAQFTEFAGYILPLYYKSISQEHLSVRHRVGIFDVSHMGRIIIQGKEADRMLNYLTVNDVLKLKVGKMHYNLFLNHDGGVLDDVTISKLSDSKFLIVVNAANRKKILNWLFKYKDLFQIDSIIDVSRHSFMFAVQGPCSKDVYEEFFGRSFSLGRFEIETLAMDDTELIISRSGYTGEDGFEIIVYSGFNNAKEIWTELLNIVLDKGGLPCGLGSRDSLRIEAGYCLYGNELSEEISPLEASLDWVVKMYKDDFIGKEALISRTVKKKRVGLIMMDKGIPRKGYSIYSLDEDRVIGWVSSGTFSPLLKKGIGMAFIDIGEISNSEVLKVDVRGKKMMIKPVDFPIYDKNKFGYTRKEAVFCR